MPSDCVRPGGWLVDSDRTAHPAVLLPEVSESSGGLPQHETQEELKRVSGESMAVFRLLAKIQQLGRTVLAGAVPCQTPPSCALYPLLNEPWTSFHVYMLCNVCSHAVWSPIAV